MDSAVYVLALVLAITMVIAALSNQIKKNKVIQERFRFNRRHRFSTRRNSKPKRPRFAQKFTKPRDDVDRPSKGFFTSIFSNNDTPKNIPRDDGSIGLYPQPRHDTTDRDYNGTDRDYHRGPTGDDDDRRRVAELKRIQEEQERRKKQERELVGRCHDKSVAVKAIMRQLENNVGALKNERPVYSHEGRARVENKLEDAQKTMHALRGILDDSAQCTSVESPITTQPVYDSSGGYK